jgi:hypothetical protein
MPTIFIPSFKEQINPFYQKNIKIEKLRDPNELSSIFKKKGISLDDKAVKEINVILMKRSAMETGRVRRLFRVSEYVTTLTAFISLGIINLEKYIKGINDKLKELQRDLSISELDAITYLAWHILYIYGSAERIEMEIRIIFSSEEDNRVTDRE